MSAAPSYDVEVAFATGGVAMAMNKIWYQGATEAVIKDGAMMTAANLGAQIVSAGKMIPVPDSLSHVADAIGTGVFYAAANQLYPVSPFSGSIVGMILYGAACDYGGEHVVLPAIHSVSPL